MNKKVNVLIFPAGEINSIELHDALSTCVNINVYGASSVDRHGGYVFKNYISGLPLINEDCFLEKFNRILKENCIDFIFPTHDTVSLFFAENANKIKAKIITSDKRTSEICRDKQKTYDLFKNYDFCPKFYKSIKKFPVFIKPKEGQGSVNAKLLNSKNDIPASINLNDYVITEYLPGEEYTIDCLTDYKGNLKYISPRSRKRIFGGVCVAGKNEKLTKEIKYIAETINKELKFCGLWFFQIKKDINGAFKLLEISTRCAGTMCLTRIMGVNLPLLTVYSAEGIEIDVLANDFDLEMDRTLINRYKINLEYDKVYLDFDDTLIFNSEVNLNVIRFIYQCKNKNKKIILITKHTDDINKTLNKFHINKNLFDDIINIKNGDKKNNHINPNHAIFIDNAFNERQEVYKKFKIPVFDVDAIEGLLDWRI